MSNKPNFICFIGLDGSGKTTLAKISTSVANKRGVQVKYVWSRYEPRILWPFVIILRLLLFKGKKMYTNPARKSSLMKNQLLSRIYPKLLLIDYSIQIFFRVKLPLIFKQMIICDRYIYDTLIDLAVDFNYSIDWVIKILDILLQKLPRPDVVFLVDVPEKVAISRKRDTPSIEYLTKRRILYLSLAKKLKFKVLDGLRDINDLKAEVESVIFN
jgi:dTMP kinase